ncbi:MAG: right-handed parallel beta-helix repeat-containing protein [Phycisphaerales bacterium]|nr:right-handed parallel beta-helix repeat-containing protein [Phycisphaerales bacterium]
MRGLITLWFGRSSGAWLAVLLLSATSTVRGERVIYVHADATGANDGSSWTDAFLDLQDALGAAESGDEIWLAGGRYTPDRGTMDRAGVFRMMGGVPLYGGFAGWEECRDDRDWAANPTILSGDLNGDDGPHDCADFSDCCRVHEGITCDNLSCQERVCAHLPDCCGSGSTVTWDASCAHFALRECCEIGNWRTCENSYIVVDATTAGSSYLLDGVHVAGAYETVTERYQVFGGVGLNSADAELIIRNTGFEGNGSFAMNVARSANTTVSACSFFRNPGIGIVAENTNLAVDGCTFVENGAPIQAYYRAIITNSVFELNTYGGVNLGGEAAVANCAFIDNDWSRAVVHRNGQLDMADCKLIGNWGGVYNVDSSLTMTNCAILGTTWWGGRLQARYLPTNSLIASSPMG